MNWVFEMKTSPVLILLILLAGQCLAQKEMISADSLNHNLKRSTKDHWFGQDKAHHFMVSAFLTGFSYYACKQEFGFSRQQANTAAVGFTMTIGVGKEIYNSVSGKGTPSFKDVIANAAGVAAGILILNIAVE